MHGSLFNNSKNETGPGSLATPVSQRLALVSTYEHRQLPSKITGLSTLSAAATQAELVLSKPCYRDPFKCVGMSLRGRQDITHYAQEKK